MNAGIRPSRLAPLSGPWCGAWDGAVGSRLRHGVWGRTGRRGPRRGERAVVACASGVTDRRPRPCHPAPAAMPSSPAAAQVRATLPSYLRDSAGLRPCVCPREPSGAGDIPPVPPVPVIPVVSLDPGESRQKICCLSHETLSPLPRQARRTSVAARAGARAAAGRPRLRRAWIGRQETERGRWSGYVSA